MLLQHPALSHQEMVEKDELHNRSNYLDDLQNRKRPTPNKTTYPYTHLSTLKYPPTTYIAPQVKPHHSTLNFKEGAGQGGKKPNCSTFLKDSVYRMTISVTMQPLKPPNWSTFQTITYIGSSIGETFFKTTRSHNHSYAAIPSNTQYYYATHKIRKPP